MPVSPARAAAFRILIRVEREQSYAAELLHSTSFSQLSAADHGLATELVMGVLRWRSWIDERISEASSQKLSKLDDEVLIALRLGVYQIDFLSRVPPHAAIFESVELVKTARKTSAASFVNAVLRKLSARAETHHANEAANRDPYVAIDDSPDAPDLARNSAHPQWLVARWVDRFGIAAVRRICAYNQQPPPTTIRIDDDECIAELAYEGIQLEPGRIVRSARTVRSGDITSTTAFREGRVAIQDEASQLVALLVGRGERILDCCAAPGGKTRLIAKQNPTSTVVAADLHPQRARLLRDRVSLPALPAHIHTLAADARQLPFVLPFDRILADVPCSGTGTLARNPEIKWRLRPEDLIDLQSRQIAILKSALDQLSPLGRLVYSTCSLEREENEEVVETALRQSPGFRLLNCRESLEQLRTSGELTIAEVDTLFEGSYLRTIPGLQASDGFFAAILERKS